MEENDVPKSKSQKSEKPKAKDLVKNLKQNKDEKKKVPVVNPKRKHSDSIKSEKPKASVKKSNWDTITRLISVLAILISLISFYFQFFHINERVVVTNLDFEYSSLDSNQIIDLKLALVNTGDTETFILKTDLVIDQVKLKPDSTAFTPMVVESNDIQVLKFEKEISLISVSGNRDLNIYLSYRYISGKGKDKKGKLHVVLTI